MECPDLPTLAACYALGESLSDDLVCAANELLNGGVYSEAAAELALMQHPVESEARPLFERMLADVGVPVPEREAAVWTVLELYIGQIAEGKVAPLDGLIRVRRVYDLADDPSPRGSLLGASHGLHDLLRTLYEYELPTWHNDAEAVFYAKQWLAARRA